MKSFLIGALVLAQSAIAYPMGAGSCPGGMAAVFGEHLEGNGRTVLTGEVTAGSLEVAIDETSLAPGSTFQATANADHTLTVTALQQKIRGILIRMESTDGTDIASSVTHLGDMIDEAQQCTLLGRGSIYGVDHVSNEQKDGATVTFSISEQTSMSLDLTVVMANNLTHTIYYYSNYTIDVADYGGDDTVGGRNESYEIDGPEGVNDQNVTVNDSSSWDTSGLFQTKFFIFASATVLLDFII